MKEINKSSLVWSEFGSVVEICFAFDTDTSGLIR